jgi:hypothetical protein
MTPEEPSLTSTASGAAEAINGGREMQGCKQQSKQDSGIVNSPASGLNEINYDFEPLKRDSLRISTEHAMGSNCKKQCQKRNASICFDRCFGSDVIA